MPDQAAGPVDHTSHADADPMHRPSVRGVQQPSHRPTDRVDNGVHGGVRNRRDVPRDDRGLEIGENRDNPSLGELDADGVTGVRLDSEQDGSPAAGGPPGRPLLDNTHVDQLGHDLGDRRQAEAGAFGQVSAGLQGLRTQLAQHASGVDLPDQRLAPGPHRLHGHLTKVT